VHYYQRWALQGHPNGVNNLGFCLKLGRGVEQNIAQAAKYYKFAADCGLAEGELIYRRCLRLLGRWDFLDRSPPPTCNPPSDDGLAELFVDCLNNPEATYCESAVNDGHPEG
jgi:TPR repeat protein